MDAPREEEELDGKPIGRAAFLGAVGVGLSSLLWGDNLLNAFSGAGKALPESVRKVVPIGDGWRIYSVNPPFPKFNARKWRLTIDGLVEKPVTLSYAEVLALPQVKQTSDFHCVTGWSVYDVGWGGVRFAQLIGAAKPKPEAKDVIFTSMEKPYVDTLSLEQAMADDALLALHMDGAPLKREHGAPARVVMPRMYGYKGVKWVNRITLSAGAEDGYWEQRGYDRDAWVGGSNGL